MKHLYFNTPIFIDDLFNDLNVKSDDKIYIVLDKLCKKIDVAKKIYTSYEFYLLKSTRTKELNIPAKFEDYGVTIKELNEIKSLLQNNQRASNSLVRI